MSDFVFDIEELSKASCDFQGKSLELRQFATENYKKEETDQLFSIRLRVDGLLVRLANNMSAEIKQTSENVSYQLSLLSSFVRTHFIINDLILTSDLVEASTLTRKQLESLTRLHELDTKAIEKLKGKTPNVQNVFGKPGKQLYPHLSTIAHFGIPRVGEMLNIVDQGSGLIGPSMIPLYNKDAHACYETHVFISIYFLFWFVGKQRQLYDHFSGVEEEEFLMQIIYTAKEAGIMIFDEATIT